MIRTGPTPTEGMTSIDVQARNAPRSRRRRLFLGVGALAVVGAGLGLAVGYQRAGRGAVVQPARRQVLEGDFRPNAFIAISTDGRVRLLAVQPEVGQGVKTALPMILAEELEVEWQQVEIVQADADPAYGTQFAGGSSSVRDNHDRLRLLGATARTMLVEAAARQWGVSAGDCEAAAGQVLHAPSGRKAGYGELAAAAAALPVPHPWLVRLKRPEQYKLIGTRQAHVDALRIVRGEPLYGQDLRLPGLRYATAVRCPVRGGTFRDGNLAEVKGLRGVVDVFVIDQADPRVGIVPAVVIVAESMGASLTARRRLSVNWQEPAAADADSDTWLARARERVRGAADVVLRNEGQVDEALTAAAKRVEAEYSYPFIAHASLETLNCTAHVQEGRAEVWASTQAPQWAVSNLATVLGLDASAVTLHLLQGGGSFGRRLGSDFIAEAALIARRIGTPVQLMWTREDDLQHDMLRPAGAHRLRAGLDGSGAVVAWHDHYATFGRGRPAGGSALAADEFPSSLVKHCRLEQSVLEVPVSMGMWRAPGANVHAWVIESFIDELAHAAGRDPLQMRLSLLDAGGIEWRPAALRRRRFDAGRMRAVLQEAASRADWGRSFPRGRGLGLAAHFSYGGYAVQFVEVDISREGVLRIPRIVSVCDVGDTIVNLSGAEAQVQGAVMDGLAAAWVQQVSVKQGRVVETNFDRYRMLRMADAPTQIDVHFLRSDNPPTGLGEPPLPPVAPALCNAIFNAIGLRIRQLPVISHDLRWT